MHQLPPQPLEIGGVNQGHVPVLWWAVLHTSTNNKPQPRQREIWSRINQTKKNVPRASLMKCRRLQTRHVLKRGFAFPRKARRCFNKILAKANTMKATNESLDKRKAKKSHLCEISVYFLSSVRKINLLEVWPRFWIQILSSLHICRKMPRY